MVAQVYGETIEKEMKQLGEQNIMKSVNLQAIKRYHSRIQNYMILYVYLFSLLCFLGIQ